MGLPTNNLSLESFLVVIIVGSTVFFLLNNGRITCVIDCTDCETLHVRDVGIIPF